MFTPSLTSWRAQYARLVRGYKRLQQPIRVPVDYEDDLIHFFQDCWHLKDWIRYDDKAGVGKAIEEKVEQKNVLKIVGDLANAAKHKARVQHRTGAYAIGNDVAFHPGLGAECIYRIELSDGTPYVATALVEQAMVAWNEVLAELELNPDQ